MIWGHIPQSPCQRVAPLWTHFTCSSHDQLGVAKGKASAGELRCPQVTFRAGGTEHHRNEVHAHFRNPGRAEPVSPNRQCLTISEVGETPQNATLSPSLNAQNK